jgi:hypothetical protein
MKDIQFKNCEHCHIRNAEFRKWLDEFMYLDLCGSCYPKY